MEPGLAAIIIFLSAVIIKQTASVVRQRRMSRALQGDLVLALSLKGGTTPHGGDGSIPQGQETTRSVDATLHTGHVLECALESGFYVRRWEEAGLVDTQTTQTTVVYRRRVVYVQAGAPEATTNGLRLTNTRGSPGRTWIRDDANGPDVLLTDRYARIEYQGHFPPELPLGQLASRCLQLVLALSHDDDACGAALADGLALPPPQLEPLHDGLGATHWREPLTRVPLNLKDQFFNLLLSRLDETAAAKDAADRPDADDDLDRGARALLVRCLRPETAEEKSRYRAAVVTAWVNTEVRTVAFTRLWPTLSPAEGGAQLQAIGPHLKPPLSDAFCDVLPTVPHELALSLIDESLKGPGDTFPGAFFRALARMAPEGTGPLLLRLLALASGQLPSKIAALLVERGHRQALEAHLIETLDTGSEAARDFAIINLGNYGTALAVPPLQARLKGWGDGALKTMIKTSVAEIQERATVGAGGLTLTAESDKAGGLSTVNQDDKVGGVSVPD